MEVLLIIFGTLSNNARGRDCCFCYFVMGDGPSILIFLIEVRNPAVWYSVCDAYVDSAWGKDSMNLFKHCLTIWSRVISTHHCVKARLINDAIKSSILKV